MNLDEFAQSTGQWLSGEGPMADVVVSSRVRLARNLADFPFLSTASDTDRTHIYRVLADAIATASAGTDSVLVDIEQAEMLDRQLLVERHVISRQHAAGEGSRGVSISPSETKALMINEEDHLRIQGLRAGMDLPPIWEEVSQIDDALASTLSFAFDQQFGYLTACPTNVGTGIRVSVMLHLPGLKMAKEIGRVEQAARDMRLAVRGLYGEGTDAIGDLYQISNQTTLGRDEAEIIKDFGEKIIPQIVQYERVARESLVRDRAYELDDGIWRAYGVLSNARCIGSEETQALLSPLRMGIHLGRFDKIDIHTLNELFLQTRPAHLQKLCGQSLGDADRDIARAELLRRRLGN